MRINNITHTPVYHAGISGNNTKHTSFTANPKLVKTLINCGIFGSTIAVGAWLAKLLKEEPQRDSIFLYDGTYLGEAHEFNKLA